MLNSKEVLGMACFLVTAVEAAVVTIAAQSLKKTEKKDTPVVRTEGGNTKVFEEEGAASIPWSRRLMWLANLLWGGAVLLAFEHIWHGEVVPWFPFLTAASDPGDLAEMLHEMSTVGVTMAVLVTSFWGVMMAVTESLLKKANAIGRKITA